MSAGASNTSARVRVALGACAGLLSATALYPILRAIAALGREPNPALAPGPTAAIPFFWRAWTCAFAGAMVAALVAGFARDPERVARALSRALPWAAAALALQAALLP